LSISIKSGSTIAAAGKPWRSTNYARVLFMLRTVLQ
jgi:hypothetical protein